MKKTLIHIFLFLIILFIFNQYAYGLDPSSRVHKLNFSAVKESLELAPLPYEKASLEPYFDKDTVTLHHDKIEQAYITNFNNQIIKIESLHGKDLDYIIKNPRAIPKEMRESMLNYVCGIYNHSFFWKSVSPQGGGNPTGNLRDAIQNQYGTLENFKTEFQNEALNQCCSGWIWIMSDNKGILYIETSPNESTPCNAKKTPLLCLDLWEHAYFLKYQNRTEEYITAFWNIVNWEFAEHNFLEGFKK